MEEKDFNDDELELIKTNLESIFDSFKNSNYSTKIGDLFIWIEKKNKKVSIRIVNQLDYYCEEYSEDIINKYKYIEKLVNSKVSITGNNDAKIELIERLNELELES